VSSLNGASNSTVPSDRVQLAQSSTSGAIPNHRATVMRDP